MRSIAIELPEDIADRLAVWSDLARPIEAVALQG